MIDRLRSLAAIWGVGGGAAALAIAIALVGMAVLFLLLGALGVESAPANLTALAQDAAVAIYAVQLVGFSFFNDTAELRFVAIPGLLLVGFSVAAATAVAVRAFPGSARRKTSVALALPVAYALLLGTAALLVPLHFTAPGFGVGVVVEPSPVEAFLLPLVWSLLFATVGGLVGVHGKNWRRAAAQRLGAWARPLSVSLRALAVALFASAALALAGAVALAGGDLSWVTGGGFGHAVKVVGGALLVLPTLAASVLVSGFGVSFDWQLNALGSGEGSVSAFGGALPTTGEDLSQAQGVPGLLALAPVIAIGMVLAIGWVSAKRSGSNARLGLANAVRAATLVTLAVWLLALLVRVEAQAGGLLGFHLAPDTGALLWRVPLVAFLGTFAGSFAWVLTRGPLARRQLAGALRSAARPRDWTLPRVGAPRPGPSSGPEATAQGLTWRAALALGFVAIPMLAIWMGATETAISAAPGEVSMAPIEREAERELERASVDDESVSANVDPETRVVSSANVETPLRALGIAPGQSRVTKAEDVLDRYGDLLGLPHPGRELAGAEVSVDEFGGIHVFFQQMADGLPVYAGAVGVHLSRKGGRLTFLSSSVIPNVSVAEGKAELSKGRAIEVAKEALPGGSLAEPVSLQVYAGLPPYVSAANARLAWTVWLLDEERHESNEYIVDAVTGEILDTVPKGSHALDREVYDAEGGSELPGTLVRAEGDPETSDEDTDNAYDHSGDVYSFYAGELGQDGIDGNGMKMISSVHVSEPSGAPLENAYWDGKAQVVFGDGFPAALDVVGHEFTHGYTQYSSGLVGTGQSGALNESVSDIAGVTIEMKKTEEIDWEIGEDLPGGLGPIRSLSEPGNLGDPASIAEWIETCLDNFGVHTNSLVTSHAFYLATTNWKPSPTFEDVAQMAIVFRLGFGPLLIGNPTASLNDARETTIAATSEYLGEEATGALEAAFEEVGLDGVAEPPVYDCKGDFDCSFALALKGRQSLTGDEAAEMLATLYKARGELAQGTPAGDHFMPLYEEHMGRVSELVSLDPELADMAVTGLEELTPALDGLVEGEGEQFDLTSERMGEIEAALERLAQDDRIYGGENAGELADLIEDELEWMGLPSYGGMNFQSGFARLNKEVEAHSLMEETGTLIDPNCTGIENGGYENNFHLNGFYVDTPGHRIAGQVSPLIAGGVICGAEVEGLEEGEKSGCIGEESLNTSASTTLPPGDQVRSTKTLTNNAWVGEAIGWAIACAGDETRILYGQAGLLSKSSWNSSECPTAAIACYEGRTVYDPGGFGEPVVGSAYSWVTEEEGVLTMTTSPVAIASQGYNIKAGFGQFEIKLCGRAGGVEAQECGGPNAPWIHQNGEAGEVGCPGGKGLYTARAKNANGEETLPVSSCVRWEPGAHMQTVDAPNSLRAVACVPGTTTCVAANNKGNAFYSTGVSASASSSWTSWTGPGVSPAHAVECPSATLCLVATGEVGAGGGNLYRASSLGGSFLTSFKPTDGVGAISCPSTSFCVTALEGGGFIRYSTNPSGILWTSVAVGTGAMKDVTCLSTSFCAVVDAAGNVRVATTEKGVKEAPGWKATNVNGATALQAVACSSTSSCIAVEGSDEVISMSIAEGGGATPSSQAIADADELTDVNCVGANCVAVDDEGAVFASTNSGATWDERFQARGKLTSVSCASSELCAAVTDGGDIIKFKP